MTTQPTYAPNPPSSWGQPPRPPKNGFGTAALVLGIIAVVFGFIPVVGVFFAIPLAILALLFGALGIVRAFTGKASNKGVSITGTSLGVAAIIVATVMTVAVFSAASDAAKAIDDSSGAKPLATKSTKDVAGKKAEDIAGIGDAVRDGKFKFTVTKVESGVKRVGPGFMAEKADGQYVVVSLKVKNIGHESQMFTDDSQYLFTKNGNKYDADGAADLVLDGSNAFLNDINPGNTVRGKIAFDMPSHAKPYSIELHDSMFSTGVTVGLK